MEQNQVAFISNPAVFTALRSEQQVIQVYIINSLPQVLLSGLTAKPELNGEIVTVTSFVPSSKRFACRLQTGEELSIKSDNLRAIIPRRTLRLEDEVENDHEPYATWMTYYGQKRRYGVYYNHLVDSMYVVLKTSTKYPES
jgi:hypothetical protein